MRLTPSYRSIADPLLMFEYKTHNDNTSGQISISLSQTEGQEWYYMSNKDILIHILSYFAAKLLIHFLSNKMDKNSY